MDDIARQAHQGSVAAIIQILNQKLADARIRTRAVFAEGVLQLLCEAALAEQLDRSVLVNQIRQILEGIDPRNIRRVRINSRIVREQQLLWLEEISRNPQELLWSEEIVLKKPNPFQKVVRGLKNYQHLPQNKPIFPKVASRKLHENSRFGDNLVKGVGFSLLLIAVGWLVYAQWGSKPNTELATRTANSTGELPPKPATSPSPPSGSTPTSDPFTEAVRLAIQAEAEGKNAQTAAQWLDLAAKWQRASDLMGAVKPEHQRYQIAQDRIALYRQNSEVAQARARQKQSR